MLNEWIMLNRYFPIYKKENYGFQNCETPCRLKLRKKINVHIVAGPKSSPPGSDIQDIPMVSVTLWYSKVFLSAAEKFIIYGLANFRLSLVRRKTSRIRTKGGQKKISITVYPGCFIALSSANFFSPRIHMRNAG